MSRPERDLWLLPAGFLIALIGVVCGIGGGLFAVPLLHFVRGLELKRAIATALVLVAATTMFGTAGELLRESPELHASLVLAVSAGALLGAEIGFFVAERIPTRALRGVFVVVLLAAAARVAFGGPASSDALPYSEWSGPTAWVRGSLAGAAGGFLAPLLGIGGGLLMVPALFLGIPGLGFGEARATSLAAGSLAALRSLWLHGRARRIETRAAAPLAAGAVGGALAGSWVFHIDGMAEVGRMSLAGILAYVALRFLYEMRRKAPE